VFGLQEVWRVKEGVDRRVVPECCACRQKHTRGMALGEKIAKMLLSGEHGCGELTVKTGSMVTMERMERMEIDWRVRHRHHLVERCL
jgi:hypothetical protein